MSNPTDYYAIPVSPGRVVYIGAPWPLTEAEWANFGTVLGLFKPGLVTDPPSDPSAGVAGAERPDQTGEDR